MYCIIHKYEEFNKTYYLAWQSPIYGGIERGYFWTNKRAFASCPCHSKEHPILFRSRKEAIAHLKSLDIPQKCSIVRWRNSNECKRNN